MSIKAATKASDADFWHTTIDGQFSQLGSSPAGLSQAQAAERLKRDGANLLNHKKPAGAWRLLLAQFKSSIILLLLFATGISFIYMTMLMPALF